LATVNYEKFFSPWEDADPGIAEGCEEEGGWVEVILN